MRGTGGACKTRAGKKKRAGRSKVGSKGRLGRGRGEEEEGGHVYALARMPLNPWKVKEERDIKGRKEEGIFV